MLGATRVSHMALGQSQGQLKNAGCNAAMRAAEKLALAPAEVAPTHRRHARWCQDPMGQGCSTPLHHVCTMSEM